MKYLKCQSWRFFIIKQKIVLGTFIPKLKGVVGIQHFQNIAKAGFIFNFLFFCELNFL